MKKGVQKRDVRNLLGEGGGKGGRTVESDCKTSMSDDEQSEAKSERGFI